MSANDRQVAGAHYSASGNKIQHWDLAVMFQWDPFQYQITKYVMRWKDKHATRAERLIDLKKALHFLEKYIEEAEHYDPRLDAPEDLVPAFKTMQSVIDNTLKEKVIPYPPEFAHALTYDTALKDSQRMLADSNSDFQCEGFYGDGSNLYKCKHCGTTQIRAKGLEHAYSIHGTCALAHGYLSQP